MRFRSTLPSGIPVEYVVPTFDDFVASGAEVDDELVRKCLRKIGAADASVWTSPETCPIKPRDLAAFRLHLATKCGVAGAADEALEARHEDRTGMWVPLASTMHQDVSEGPFSAAGTWVHIAEPQYADLRRARDVAGARVVDTSERGQFLTGIRTTAELLRFSIDQIREGGKARKVDAIDVQEWPWPIGDMLVLYRAIDLMTSPTVGEVLAMGEAEQVVTAE